MDVFHVQVVRGDGIGHRVLRKDLRLLDRVPALSVPLAYLGRFRDARRHELRVELDGRISQLGRCDSLEALTALRQVRVALDPSAKSEPPAIRAWVDPPEAVHVHARFALVLHLIIWAEPNLVVHADTVDLGPGVDERKVEAVTVIRRHDGRFRVPDMLKPSPNHTRLIRVSQ